MAATTGTTYGSGFITNRRGRRLFYAEHHPDSAAPVGPVWVICPPILEEKNSSQGVFVHLARELTRRGVRVLRIDYEGHGDSDGDVSALGLHEWAHDVIDVVSWLRADGRTDVVLLGCRAGALIAALAARAVAPVRLVAWCPIGGGHDDAQELLRLNLTTQLAVEKAVVRPRAVLERDLMEGGVVNLLGWDIGKPLYESLRTLRFATLVAGLTCPVEIIDVQLRSGEPGDEPQPQPVSSNVSRRAVPGRPFWLDAPIVDFQQPALLAATLERAAPMESS